MFSELVIKFMPDDNDGSILDLACGTGSLAINLAKNGYDVTGIDMSSEMIEIAKLKKNSLRGVRFELANMLNPNLDKRFSVVTCAFDSVNYLLNESDLKKMFSSAYKHLNPKGRFIFDFNTEKAYKNNNNFEIRRILPGGYYDHKMQYDTNTNLAHTSFEFYDGQWELHIQKPYEHQQVVEILEEVGFEILFSFKNFKGEPVKKESDRIFIVAEKPGIGIKKNMVKY
ncbi:class I SAM-dependent methyltransferase [Proteinivorax hydrogeniformans]|uniref:Class I SAM-dependent methyltransferase n=1 Tax=Proteinivorax hydrogeniformans TaxID=1826727 RepID=A0AAU8HS03_9FIRM